MNTEPNPFVKVHDALWELVERNDNIKTLIKMNNRIKYEDWVGDKPNITTSDLPELALLSTGGSANLQISSSHTQVTRTYDWMLTTGDFRINEVYNDILWEFFVAMIGWQQAVCALTWKGEDFVMEVRMNDLDEGPARIGQNRNIRGWASIWSCEVDMQIALEFLRIV